VFLTFVWFFKLLAIMSMKFNSLFIRTLLTMAWVLLMGSALLAQQVIKGTVTSASSGDPLSGATVLVKGTTVGAFTDEDGKYSIKANDGDMLLVSYIGYLRQEIAIEGQTTIDVSLAPSEKTLDEVVVTGYGTQKATQVTSAITSVKAEDFNAGQVNDPTQLIQGKVAGLNISKPGGDPNGGFNIRLRGISTFGAGASPLIVIDGVIGAQLNSVDPSDIAEISVLKDGSAAAIYGTRASAGVIIITTKRGVAGDTKVNYSGFVSAESVDRTLPVASREQFLELKGEDQDQGANTNWVDEVTRPGISQVHNLSLSGGVGSTSYRASANFRNIRGVGVGSGFDQLNARLNLTQKALNDKLTLSVDLTNTVREADFGFNESFRYANLYNPTAPVQSDDPSFENVGGYFQAPNFDYFNPVAIAEQNFSDGELKTLITSLRGTYELIDGLTGSIFVSRQRRSNLYGQFYSRESLFRGGATIAGGGVLGRAQQNTEEETNDLLEGTINYNQDFGTIGLDILGGYSWNEVNYRQFGIEGTGLPSDAFTYNNLAALQAVSDPDIPLNVFSAQNSFRVIGFFGRARLNINDIYNVTASLRYEGASRFGDGNKWGYFPAVSASADLGKLLNVNGIDEMKLRAGYGVTGALPGSSYQSQLLFGAANFFPINGEQTQAIGPINNANPNLRWERKGEFNVGLDFQLLDYKLSGTIDYYNRSVRDLLVPGTPLPSPPFTLPTGLANLNNVALRSSGLEVSLGYLLKSGNFSYEPNVAFTAYFETRLDSVPGVEADFPFGEGGQRFDNLTSPGAPGLNDNPTILIQIGSPLGQFYGYEIDVAASEAEDRWVNVDQNGDGEITTDDQTVIGGGTGIPRYSLGFNNGFRIGDLDFSFFLRGDFGHRLLNMYRLFYEPIGSDRSIENTVITDSYQNINDAPQVNQYFIEDASFLVLDNAQIGYSFSLPGKRSLRVYAAGQNLFWLTNYTGVDPSVSWADPGASDNGGRPSREFAASPLAPGLARRNIYFTTRTFTLGVNLQL
jgi:iron complex outermembrane receptor protein